MKIFSRTLQRIGWLQILKGICLWTLQRLEWRCISIKSINRFRLSLKVDSAKTILTLHSLHSKKSPWAGNSRCSILSQPTYYCISYVLIYQLFLASTYSKNRPYCARTCLFSLLENQAKNKNGQRRILTGSSSDFLILDLYFGFIILLYLLFVLIQSVQQNENKC